MPSLWSTPTTVLPAADRSDVRNSPSCYAEIIDAVVNQRKGSKVLGDALKVLQAVSKNVASLIGRESDIFCMLSLAGSNSDNRIL